MIKCNILTAESVKYKKFNFSLCSFIS